jgi:hypothetical protein
MGRVTALSAQTAQGARQALRSGYFSHATLNCRWGMSQFDRYPRKNADTGTGHHSGQKIESR